MTRHNSCRVSPFGHPRIHARLTAPRGISQPPTSFIGSQCQGIHHAPLNTYNTKPKNESPKNPQKNRNPRATTKLHTTDTQPKSRAPRCSQPLSTNQTPHPTTKAGQQQTPPDPNGPKAGTHPTHTRQDRGLVVSKPNSVSGNPEQQPLPAATITRLLPHQTRLHYREQAILTNRPENTANPRSVGPVQVSWCSLERR